MMGAMTVTQARTPAIDADTAATWLACWRFGFTIPEIADECGVSAATVHAALSGAIEREGPPPVVRPGEDFPPALLLSFGVGTTPLALLTCDDVHPRGPIPAGSTLCCAVCHKSGLDDHPALYLGPADVPPSEPETPPDGA